MEKEIDKEMKKKEEENKASYLIITLVVIIFIILGTFVIFYLHLHNIDLAFNFLKDETKTETLIDCYAIKDNQCVTMPLIQGYVNGLGVVSKFPILFVGLGVILGILIQAISNNLFRKND